MRQRRGPALWLGGLLLPWGCPCPPATSGCPQALVKEANAHGEKLSSLEAVASRLKDFSRKQDGAVIQNLVLTAKERLGKVLQHTAERGAALEEARKRTKQVPGRAGEGTGPAGSCAGAWAVPPWHVGCAALPVARAVARGPCSPAVCAAPAPRPRCAVRPAQVPSSLLQFSESRRLLLDWMDEAEQALEVPQDTATSQEEIKCQLAEHKVRGERRCPALRGRGSPTGAGCLAKGSGSRAGGCGAAAGGSPAPSPPHPTAGHRCTSASGGTESPWVRGISTPGRPAEPRGPGGLTPPARRPSRGSCARSGRCTRPRCGAGGPCGREPGSLRICSRWRSCWGS